MLFTTDIDIFGKRLEAYRRCFSKPQWRHFKTCMNGLILGEKCGKNIQDIASNTIDGRNQSSLNRFLTRHKWNARMLNTIRLGENLKERNGGVLILDDTLIEKTGKNMDGVGYLYDHAKKKSIQEIGEKRFRWLYETTVVMKNVGAVKLVILKERINSKKCMFLVSNDIMMDGMKIFEYYKKRWNIEVFYRDCKQHLGMGEYQVRKLDAVVIHLHLVFLAYALLKNNCFNPILNTILHGIKTIGSICSRLKRWGANNL